MPKRTLPIPTERLHLDLSGQPTDTSCGPTCLQGIYQHYGDPMDLQQLIEEIPSLENGGGTLAVHLGNHALKRGYRARMYTYNLAVFDPTWFKDEAKGLSAKLTESLHLRRDRKRRQAIKAYLEFLSLGGEIRMKDLSVKLLKKYLTKKKPILTGLSSTYLYQSPREIEETTDYDDLKGEPSGHFMILCSYDKEMREAWVADPYHDNPSGSLYYSVCLDRLVNAILLGVLTYDANLLVIEPAGLK